jgi:hypothetical protein
MPFIAKILEPIRRQTAQRDVPLGPLLLPTQAVTQINLNAQFFGLVSELRDQFAIRQSLQPFDTGQPFSNCRIDEIE